MILTKEVEIKISGRNIKHFKSLGYNVKYGDIIYIPPEHLSKGSHIKIKVKCDFCNIENNMEYRTYLKNISIQNKCACKKCAGNKMTETWKNKTDKEIKEYINKNKQTKLRNYGDENYNNRKKAKKTCLEKYDDENFTNRKKCRETKLNNYGNENFNNPEKIKQSWISKTENEIEEINKKRIETCIKKYGLNWITQLEDIKNKIKQTKKERYGDETFINAEKIIETWKNKTDEEIQNIINRTKLTKKEKYNDENYHNVEQMKKTNLEKYGVEYVFQLEKIRKKAKQTCLEKYGVENPFQIPEVIDKIFETKFGITYDEYFEQLPDFIRYKNIVWKFTRKQPLNLLENYKNRGLTGIKNAYHIDHKYSMKEGFINSICPYIIGNIINLEMLPYKDNLSKNCKCSISCEELFESYDRGLKII